MDTRRSQIVAAWAPRIEFEPTVSTAMLELETPQGTISLMFRLDALNQLAMQIEQILRSRS